jgi:hypothetical protein
MADVSGSATRCDLSLRYGNMQEEGADVRILFQDRIIALGTPRFARDHQIKRAAVLCAAPMIHSANDESD